LGRQVVKDEMLRTLGFIEQEPDGRLKATTAEGETAGWYDPEADMTLGPDLKAIGPGDGLADLVFEADRKRAGA
jgi:hypothetical protein